MELYYRDLEVNLLVKVKDATYYDDAIFEEREFTVDYEYEADDEEVIEFIAEIIMDENEDYEKVCEKVEANKDYYFKKYESEIEKAFKLDAKLDAEKKGEDYFF